METVYKYELAPLERQVVEMPRGAKVLSFHANDDRPCIWALVETEMPTVGKTVYLVGTGRPIPDSPTELRFIGTALFHGDTVVYHLFI